ncbi:MAG: reverse transcriptase domain-containing protein [Rivularia sp. (in: cyanobacteria)]
MRLSSKAKPTRRVWIPKPGKSEKRPLGIPTMHDRALQNLVKMTLEPEWEAKFEPNSYGFRPGVRLVG